jgi:hypothetical protein
MEPLLQTLLGAAISALVGLVLFRVAGEQLMREASRLRKLNELILLALEEAKMVRLIRNEAREIVGMAVSREAAETLGLSEAEQF